MCALYLQNTRCVCCVALIQALFNLKYRLSCNTCNTDAKLGGSHLQCEWLQWAKPQKNWCWFLLLIANGYVCKRATQYSPKQLFFGLILASAALWGWPATDLTAGCRSTGGDEGDGRARWLQSKGDCRLLKIGMIAYPPSILPCPPLLIAFYYAVWW